VRIRIGQVGLEQGVQLGELRIGLEHADSLPG
jgi:hypothetical protein